MGVLGFFILGASKQITRKKSSLDDFEKVVEVRQVEVCRRPNPHCQRKR